jgi:hypothetical protein
MKLNTSVSNFLTNKWVLNIVALLALFNVIGYMVIGNLNAVLYFVVFAILFRYFSKNMTIVLGVPLIITNLLALKGNMIEGMENNESSQSTDQSATQNNNNDNEDKKNVNSNKNNKDSKSSQGLPMHSIDDPKHDTTNNAAQSTGGEQQGFEPGRRKNRGYEIDYATTIEDAYDQLNNILGSDGVQRLTSDTQKLMKQQMNLAEAMKNMQPVVESIAPMVKNLQGMMGQMGDGKDGLGGILDLAKKFSSQAAPAK